MHKRLRIKDIKVRQVVIERQTVQDQGERTPANADEEHEAHESFQTEKSPGTLSKASAERQAGELPERTHHSSQTISPAEKPSKAEPASRISGRQWRFYTIPVAIAFSVVLVWFFYPSDRRVTDIPERTGRLPGPQSAENGKKMMPDQNPALKPTLWVLSIGVSKYKESSLNLQFADHDAEQISALLKKQEGKLFKEVKSTVLVNKEVDRDSILNAVKTISEGGLSYDVVFIFVAGHGMLDAGLNSYYFLLNP